MTRLEALEKVASAVRDMISRGWSVPTEVGVALDALPVAPAQAQAQGETVVRELEAYRSNGGSVVMVFQGSMDHYHAERHWTRIGPTVLTIRATEGGGE
jgi:hypothetical protein